MERCPTCGGPVRPRGRGRIRRHNRRRRRGVRDRHFRILAGAPDLSEETQRALDRDWALAKLEIQPLLR
jgi:hypothetical protein